MENKREDDHIDQQKSFERFEKKPEDKKVDQRNKKIVYDIEEISNLIGIPIIIHDF